MFYYLTICAVITQWIFAAVSRKVCACAVHYGLDPLHCCLCSTIFRIEGLLLSNIYFNPLVNGHTNVTFVCRPDVAYQCIDTYVSYMF